MPSGKSILVISVIAILAVALASAFGVDSKIKDLVGTKKA
jgi:hypothetical protein